METCFVFDFDLFSNPQKFFSVLLLFFYRLKQKKKEKRKIIRQEYLQLNLKGCQGMESFVASKRTETKNRE